MQYSGIAVIVALHFPYQCSNHMWRFQVTVRLRDRVASSLGRGLRVRDRVGVRVRTLF